MAISKAVPPIAVIGMAARFPGADDVEQYWTNLVEAVESIHRGPEAVEGPDLQSGHERFVRAVAKVGDVELFDAEYFRIPPAEAALMDPQHRVLLEVAVAAMQDAGYHGAHDAVVGVFVGCGENYYLRDFVTPHEQHAVPAPDNPRTLANGTDTRVLTANEKDFLASRIAFKLGLDGPSITVQSACSTSLSAVALACSALAAGDCDIALAGGVSLLMPDMDGYVYAPGGIFSRDGRCRSFDAEASGTVPGSGAALVVLRRDDDAKVAHDRRRGVIRGWAVNNDGGSGAGFTAPSASGQQAVIQAALTRAGISPDEVGYIETHGTATPIGDPVELEALRRVFETGKRAHQPCVLGAVKTNIGHADAAAGIAGLIKAVLAVERGTIPATLHFRAPNAAIDLPGSPFALSSETLPWPGGGPRIAGVSAFGLGGNNAHVLVQEPAALPTGGSERPRQVVGLSARSEAELQQLRSALAARIQGQPSFTAADLADAAFTLAVGRPQFEYRWATCVSDSTALVAELNAPAEPARPALRWSLSIHGTHEQQAEMGRRLLAEEPLFRTALAELIGEPELDHLPVLQAAAVSALTAAQLLKRLGMSFGRIDAPQWMGPAVDWLSGGGDPGTLNQALDACMAHHDTGVAREGTGCLLIGPEFEVAAAAGRAWAHGARIDWRRYFAAESRGRIPLPTYPFNRRRYWLPRVVRELPEPRQETVGPAAGVGADDVFGAIETVWRSVLGLDAVDRDAHFIHDLAGDSMYAVEIGARLTEIFQLDLPLDLPFIAPTVASSAQYVEEALVGATAGDREQVR
ncbi:beta-ketoacyl synthase N-terminal-like domain-containing protein [Streptomyces sp. NPDC059917]|uniref:beta-ketoacyl synthase N-terminal-like domain-containing protein n=1 Tax=Streptomyces sp. NPDC059917 TaxID=3347002 RepID=UPI003668E5A6